MQPYSELVSHGSLFAQRLVQSQAHCINLREIALSQADAWNQLCGATYLVPDAVNRVLGTTHLVPGTWYQEVGTEYFVPTTRYQVRGTRCLVPDQ